MFERHVSILERVMWCCMPGSGNNAWTSALYRLILEGPKSAVREGKRHTGFYKIGGEKIIDLTLIK